MGTMPLIILSNFKHMEILKRCASFPKVMCNKDRPIAYLAQSIYKKLY